MYACHSSPTGVGVVGEVGLEVGLDFLGRVLEGAEVPDDEGENGIPVFCGLEYFGLGEPAAGHGELEEGVLLEEVSARGVEVAGDGPGGDGLPRGQLHEVEADGVDVFFDVLLPAAVAAVTLFPVVVADRGALGEDLEQEALVAEKASALRGSDRRARIQAPLHQSLVATAPVEEKGPLEVVAIRALRTAGAVGEGRRELLEGHVALTAAAALHALLELRRPVEGRLPEDLALRHLIGVPAPHEVLHLHHRAPRLETPRLVHEKPLRRRLRRLALVGHKITAHHAQLLQRQRAGLTITGVRQDHLRRRRRRLAAAHLSYLLLCLIIICCCCNGLVLPSSDHEIHRRYARRLFFFCASENQRTANDVLRGRRRR